MKENDKKRKVPPMKGIKAKMLLVILPLVAISLMVVILTANNMSKKSLMADAEEILHLTGDAAAYEISGWLGECLSGIETITYTILNEKMDETETRAYLENILGADENFHDGMYMAAEDGTLVDGSGWVHENDPRESDWYIEGQKHADEFYFIEPYVDSLDRTVCCDSSKENRLEWPFCQHGMRYPSGNC